MEVLQPSSKPSTRLESPTSTQIQHWRENAKCDNDRPDLGVVARAVITCFRSLGFIIKHTPPKVISTSQRLCLQRRHTSLKLWADGHSVADGKLDTVLDLSEDLRQTLLAVLSPMCKSLLRALDAIPVPRDSLKSSENLYASAEEAYNQMQYLLVNTERSSGDPHSDSDDSSDSTESTSTFGIERLLVNLTIYTQCLIDLSVVIQCPAVTLKSNDVVSGLRPEERTASQYHADLISGKYPNAHTVLVDRLGQISWARFLRMQHERQLNSQRLEHQEPVVAGVAKTLTSVSEFQDSGLGTSIPAAPTSYAKSTVSFMTSISGGERVRIPPLPAEGRKGLPFGCIACGNFVRAANNREWRKHLYADLCPYVCFFSDCQFSVDPFSSRQLWSDHLELDHTLGPAWKSIRCPICQHMTGLGKHTVLSHFARHLEDIALIALGSAVDSDAESDHSLHSSRSSASESDPQVPRITGSVLNSGRLTCSISDCYDVIFGRLADQRRHTTKAHKGAIFPPLGLDTYEASQPREDSSYYSAIDPQGSTRITSGHILKDGRFVCVVDQKCRSLRFGGLADLKRHFSARHTEAIAEYFCPVSGCQRSKTPAIKGTKVRSFGSRKDKMEEHFLVVHKRPAGQSTYRDPSIQGSWSDLLASEDKSPSRTPNLLSTTEQVKSSTQDTYTISKAAYVRPQHPKIMCQHCHERPSGFRGTYELDRHIARAHAAVRKGYICVAPSFNKNFLDNCEHCRNSKVYGAYYNAAAHLRRAHFRPKLERKDGKRTQLGGGDYPAMEWLREHWIKEVDVPNDKHPPDDDSNDPSLQYDVPEEPNSYYESEGLAHPQWSHQDTLDSDSAGLAGHPLLDPFRNAISEPVQDTSMEATVRGPRSTQDSTDMTAVKSTMIARSMGLSRH